MAGTRKRVTRKSPVVASPASAGGGRAQRAAKRQKMQQEMDESPPPRSASKRRTKSESPKAAVKKQQPPPPEVVVEDERAAKRKQLEEREEELAREKEKLEAEEKLAQEEAHAEREREKERERLEEERRIKTEKSEQKKRQKAKGKNVMDVEYNPEATTATKLSEPNQPMAAAAPSEKKKPREKGPNYTELWSSMLNKLKKYKEDYGDCRVPRRWAQDTALGNWVRTQRQSYLAQRLSEERRIALEEAGFEFVIPPHVVSWDAMFTDLEEFKDKHGNCDVPTGYDESPQLLYWTFYQREQHRKGELSDERIAQLESLGFEWHHRWPSERAGSRTVDEIWQMQFKKLVRYKEHNGNLDVPAKYLPDQTFAKWVDTQRLAHRRGQLTDERVNQLEDLGFDWSHTHRDLVPAPTPEQERMWQWSFEKLKAFQAENGHCDVTAEVDPALTQWIKTQKKVNRRNQMIQERKEALESIGFVFDAPAESPTVEAARLRAEQIWNTRLEEVKKFKEEFGHCNVPGTFARDPVLGRWIGTQRTAYRRGQMPQDRIDALEELGFRWRVTDAGGNSEASAAEAWNTMLEKLKEFLEEHGNCNVPANYAEDLALSRWVKTQRLANRAERLSEERKAALDALGFDFRIQDSDLIDPGDNSIWEMQFNRLRLYRDLNGDCAVPRDYALDPELARWVNTQRLLNRRNQVSKQHKEALDSLGFDWRRTESSPPPDLEGIWNTQFEKLKIFKLANGHCNVPNSYPPDPTFARWISTQRTVYRRNQMNEDRKQKLNSIGFEWRLGPRGRTFEESLELLREYKEKHGHCFINLKGEDTGLKSFVTSSRQRYSKGVLPSDCVQQLEAIGFAWTAEQEKDALWEHRWNQLKVFKENEANGAGQGNPTADTELLTWVTSQQSAYFSNKLSPERTEKLLSIGFIFNGDMVPADGDKKLAGSRISWNKHYEALLEFKDMYGHTNVPPDFEQNLLLARWVANQRKLHSKGQGPTAERIEKLESIGFDWTLDPRRASFGPMPTPPVAALPPPSPFIEEDANNEAEAPPQQSTPGRASVAGAAAATTPTMTWARGRPLTPPRTATRNGVQQMAVSLEMERTKLDNQNKELKRANQKLQTTNQSLTKKLAEVEAAFRKETQELRERLNQFEEMFGAQAETLRNHGQQLTRIAQNGQDANGDQVREHTTALQTQGNQLTQLSQQVQEMRQMQYTLQHQVGVQGLTYRL